MGNLICSKCNAEIIHGSPSCPKCGIHTMFYDINTPGRPYLIFQNFINICIKGEITPSISNSFNTTKSFGWFYDKLNDKDKKTYVTILKGLLTVKKRIPILYYPLEELSIIYRSVLKDNTYIFYDRFYSRWYADGDPDCEVEPEYTFSAKAIKENMEKVREYLKRFDILKGKSDYDKVKGVYDYCISNFKYDNQDGPNKFNIMGLILNKKAVCEGIAEFVKLALDYLSVKCIYVTGESDNPQKNEESEGHAWNIVYVEGKPYHLDATWDICGIEKLHRYDYFMLCDEDIKRDHIIKCVAPACTTKGKDYYTQNSLLAKDYPEFERIIERNLQKGVTHFMVKFLNITFTQDIKNRILDKASKIFVNQAKRNIKVKGCFDEKKQTCEFKFI